MSALRGTIVVIAAALGASLASFVTLVAERRARGESVRGRSHCVCGRQLRPAENVPVLGYVARRGRAPCCGAGIPPRYLVYEIIGALLVAAAAWGVTTS